MAAAPPAGGGALGALPVPAPFPATIASIFADNSKDPASGNLGALMSPFFHDTNNQGNNTETATIRNRLAQSGAQRRFLSATVVSGGKARLYSFIYRWEDDLITSHPELNYKFYGVEGELIENVGHTVELPDTLFNLQTNSQTVPTIPTIVAALTADAGLELMGPYVNGDANTDTVKTRRIVPVPHVVGGIWLTKPDGITPREFWELVYPVIVSQGIENECRSLLQFFQIAITQSGAGATSSTVDAVRPSPPARSVALMKRQSAHLQHHFPQLRSDAPEHQAGLIAQGLGVIAQQQQDQYQETRREKELAKETTVRRWFGENMFKQLLRMLRLRDEAELNRECSVFLEMAKSHKAGQQGVLQSAIRQELTDRKDPYLQVTITPGLWENFKSLEWARDHEDSLLSGFLANLLLWGGSDEGQQKAVNRRANMMQSGDTAVSDADAQEILKVKVNLPMETKSIDNVRRLDVICSVILPAGHPFRKYVKEHLEHLLAFREKWDEYEMPKPEMQAAKGVCHCIHFSSRADRYWRRQAMSDQDVPLPSPTEMTDDIEAQRDWVPLMSSTLKIALKWESFCRVGKGHLESGQNGDEQTIVPGGRGSIIPSSAATDVSSLTEAATLASFLARLGASGYGLPPTGGPSGGGGGGGGGGGDKTEPNLNYNAGLFGEYKTRKGSDGKAVRSKDILRAMISRGELPPLPPSKVDPSISMCLAWHTKGMCNPGCPCAPDHKAEYSNDEYKPMKGWCTSNYPGESA